jgi:putative addiction module component (TIGR02574 family)
MKEWDGFTRSRGVAERKNGNLGALRVKRSHSLVVDTPPGELPEVVYGFAEGRPGVTIGTMTRVEELYSRALELDVDERENLADLIYDSLGGELAGETDISDEEVQSRIEDIRSGRVEMLSWTSVREKLIDPTKRPND